MKLIKFFTLTAFLLMMAGCLKEPETDIRIVSLSPQTVIDDQVEFVAELGTFTEGGTEVVTSDRIMLPVTLPLAYERYTLKRG